MSDCVLLSGGFSLWVSRYRIRATRTTLWAFYGGTPHETAYVTGFVTKATAREAGLEWVRTRGFQESAA
jgi:hypothetical protein